MLMILLSGKTFLSANPASLSPVITLQDSIFISDTSYIKLNRFTENFIISHGVNINSEKKKKLISAMLAFPFPFGFMGAHRVMLGCKPWIPVVYMATFGGCFGLLPMIDFCVILFSKDIEQFENNPHVFMWLK
jgi:TM2 domain-containing membrane protein YozV